MNGGTVCLAIVASQLAAIGFADSPPMNGPAPNPSDNDVVLILDNPLPEKEYTEQIRCLNPGSYRSIEVLDASHLLFWGRRGHVWLNQLRSACFGLNNDQVLQFKMNGNNLCEFDNFQGIDRNGATAIPTAFCSLQRFELITDDQAKQLRDTLKRRAHTATPAPPAPEKSRG